MEGASSEKTFEALIFSFGAMKACKSQRANFVLCRATPQGKVGEPSHCQSQANALLTCYSGVAQKSQGTAFFMKLKHLNLLRAAAKQSLLLEIQYYCIFKFH